MNLSVIIPAYNESQRIGNSLQEMARYFEGQEVEILVVNDGSTDDTIAVVESLQLPQVRIIGYGSNRGKGYAVQQGVMASVGQQILISDADLSTPIRHYEDLAAELPSAPVVIASRGMDTSEVDNHPIRIWLGKFGNRLIRVVLPGIKDSQCGFKLFEGEVGRTLFSKQQLTGFGFDFEILFIARLHGYLIREIPVSWVNAEGSKVKPWHYLATLRELLQVVLNHWIGKYR